MHRSAVSVDDLEEIAVRAELVFHLVEQQSALVVLDEAFDSLDAVAQAVVYGAVEALLHREPDRDAEHDGRGRERGGVPQRQARADRAEFHAGGVSRRQ
jgi:hypothetical protein